MDEKRLESIVADAVARALREGSLVDGPMHIAHHQAIEEFLLLARHARKTAVGAFVMAVLTLAVFGLALWKS